LDNDDEMPPPTTETFKRLIGHSGCVMTLWCRRDVIAVSGAVYGLSFSPDNKWLLSASADATVRACLVEAVLRVIVDVGSIVVM
jgi:WD40 repeat protein